LFPFVCFLVPGRLTTKEDGYTSDFRGSQNYLRRRKNRSIIEATNAIMHDLNLSMILWAEACMTQYMFRTGVLTRSLHWSEAQD
jgi:hypothetical protein